MKAVLEGASLAIARSVSRRLGPASARRREGLTNLGWSCLTQVVNVGLKFVSTLIVTRLLSVEAYGIFGTALAVVTTLEWLSDVGVQPALVRHPEGGTRRFLDTGWWICLIRGVALTALCAALSYPLAKYYDQPSLAPVLLVLSLWPVLGALRSPGMPSLRRELNYQSLFHWYLAQMVVGTGVSLALAWYTRSVWAIVWGTLTSVAVGTALSYVIKPGLPGLSWDKGAMKDLAHISRQVFINTLFMALWLNADRLFGLSLISPGSMGLYAVAWGLAAALEGLVIQACDVYFSMLARRTDPEDRATWHRSVCVMVASWGMPVAALGIATAPLVISVLYDRRYAGAGILLSLLLARVAVRSLGQLQYEFLLAGGKIGINTVSFAAAFVTQAVLLLLFDRHWGATGLAATALASTLVYTVVQTILIVLRGDGSLRPLATTLAWVLVGVMIATVV